MKGKQQGVCIGCGERKGDRDRNAGWYELSPRDGRAPMVLFCPACSGAMLVELDARMAEAGKLRTLRAVQGRDLERIAILLSVGIWENAEATREVSHFISLLLNMTKTLGQDAATESLRRRLAANQVQRAAT